MASKKLRHEIILWRDAWAGYDYNIEANEVETGHFLISSGWLVKEDRDEVVIAMQKSAHSDDTRSRHLHGILKKNIISRRSASMSVRDPRKQNH